MEFNKKKTLAEELDKNDQLARFRSEFLFPKHNGKDVVYFCGNSLGLQPKKTRQYIEQELDDWSKYGVEGHFDAKNSWYDYHEPLIKPMADVVGAQTNEVAIMNTLTVNLHLMMVSFYRPKGTRIKIIYEANAFPSDSYALQSQAQVHGLDPAEALVKLSPRSGEHTLRTADIISKINECGDSLAMVMMGGVNYYTGQLFDMKSITEAAHNVGACAGFDLAHAAGNIAMKLHDWDVDFAVWCSYKYLNSGPGGVAACFIHERNAQNTELPRFAGWWGNDPATRFKMQEDFVPVQNAGAWQLSNAPVLNMAALRASLDIFHAAGIEKLRNKSKVLTAYCRYLLEDMISELRLADDIEIITPESEEERGCQLSMLVHQNGKAIFEYITNNGIVGDWREPDVIRIAPVPLYNSFSDVYRFYESMKEACSKYTHA